MEEIIVCIGKSMIAIAAVYMYIYLTCSVYPWLTMRLVWKSERYQVRGLRRVKYDGGRGVVYQGALHVRKYIYKYAIYTEGEDKCLRCQINPRIQYMRYDVISFDSRGRLLDVVCVSEKIKNAGGTEIVMLPTRTSFAYVVPRVVDGMYESRERVLRYSRAGSLVFLGLCVLTTLVMTYFVYDGLSTVFGYMYRWFEPVEPTFLFGRAVLYALICGSLALLSYHRHSVKVINR